MNYSILPLLIENHAHRFLCYNGWKISPESLEDFIGIRTQRQIEKDIHVFSNLKDQSIVPNFSKLYHSLYDLKSIGLITYSRNKVFFTEQGKLIFHNVGKSEFKESIANEALKTKKIKQAAKYLFEHPTCTKKEFENTLSDLTSNIKSKIVKKQIINVIYDWAKFIFDHSNNANWIQ